jgi:hypothetical protein
MINLAAWQNEVLGKVLNVTGKDPGECTQVPLAWGMELYPGKKWSALFPPVKSAKDMLAIYNKSYFWAIANDHNDPNQLPQAGDIMIFDATPQKGYANTYQNPYGHAGVCVSASPSGYTLLGQSVGHPVNDTSFMWRWNPCKGWLHPLVLPLVVAHPGKAPVMSSMVGKTLHLPAKNPDGSPDTHWNVYHENGPYDVAQAVAVLNPALFGGLSYKILTDKGNGIYAIQTQMFGRVAIWTRGTNATIN